MPPVNDVIKINRRPYEQNFFPTEFMMCPACGLFQLGTIVSKEILFPSNYPYTSSTTKILRENFKKLSTEARKVVDLDNEDLVIDIGSNDGNLLSNFTDYSRVLGITPELVGKKAIKRGIDTIISYFDPPTVSKVLKKYGKAKIITATNVFAHIDNVNTILKLIKKLLDKKGIFISESHYLLSLFEDIQYDTIYHEHLRYYSIKSLNYLFKKHGFEIFKVQKINTHGGSIRVFAAYKNTFKKNKNISKFLEQENKKIYSISAIKNFKKRIILSKSKLYKLLSDIKDKNKRIIGVGAPSRSSILINYVGLDNNFIDFTFEIKGSKKIGTYMPGTRIPIIEENLKLLKKDDYLILFSWHISNELILKIKNLGFKGFFIIPLPYPKIVK